MQECLAAHFIASTKEEEKRFLNNNFWDSRYLNTGVMYVGITKGESQAFKNFLHGTSGFFSKLLGIHKATNKVKQLHFFNCLLEAKNNELSESQVDKILHKKTIDLSYQTMQQKDIHTLSFFLARSTIKCWQRLDLSNCFVSGEYLENFSEMTQTKITNVSISLIDLSGNELSHSVDATTDLINCFSVKRLIIADHVAEDLTNDNLMASIEHFETYDHKIQYVLATETKLVAYNAQYFQILQTIKTPLMISDLEIIDSNVSKNALKEIALCLSNKFKVLKSIKVTDCKIKDEDLHEFFKKLCSASSNLKTSIFLNTMDISHNCLTSTSVDAILTLLKCSVIEKLIVSNNSINNNALTDTIFQQACSEGDIIQNFTFGTPLVIINTNTLQQDNSSKNMEQVISIFIMKCVIDTKAKDLALQYCNQISRIFIVNIIVATTDLGTNLLNLCHLLPNINEVFVYERYLKDEVAQEIAICLTEETKLHISFILASSTRLFAKNSSDQLIAPLLDNSLINTLQLNSVDIVFSSDGKFLRSLTSNSRNWDIIDLSDCNINDDGLLKLHKCFTALKSTIRYINLTNNNCDPV